jgi:hypothetical protein
MTVGQATDSNTYGFKKPTSWEVAGTVLNPGGGGGGGVFFGTRDTARKQH